MQSPPDDPPAFFTVATGLPGVFGAIHGADSPYMVSSSQHRRPDAEPQARATRPEAGAANGGEWRLFDRIAHRYDLLNRLLSARQDVLWRNRVLRRLPAGDDLRVLDLATGTGDMLLTLEKVRDRVAVGVGVDMSSQMLKRGRRKLDRRGLGAGFSMVRADAGQTPFAPDSFDAVTMAFGIRNMPDAAACLAEIHRLLKPGGRALVLELTTPTHRRLLQAYLCYFRHILPRIGGLISGDREAYRYLNRSVEAFPQDEAFCQLMKDAGFQGVAHYPLSCGAATLYAGDKRPAAAY